MRREAHRSAGDVREPDIHRTCPGNSAESPDTYTHLFSLIRNVSIRNQGLDFKISYQSFRTDLETKIGKWLRKAIIKGFETVTSSFPNFLSLQKKLGAKFEIK